MPNERPEGWIFRQSVFRLLRTLVAFQGEADSLAEYTWHLPADQELVRSEEGGLLDSIIRTAANLKGILGLEIKSLVVKYSHDGHLNVRSGPVWSGNIKFSYDQSFADVWSTCFPLLRHGAGHWVSIHRPLVTQAPGSAYSDVRFSHSDAGQVLDQIVPPDLWPDLLKSENATKVLTALLDDPTQNDARELQMHFPSGKFSMPRRMDWQLEHTTTLAETYNKRNPSEGHLVQYLENAFEARTSSKYEILSPTYRPLTADMIFQSKMSGRMAFVEIKAQMCERPQKTSTGYTLRHLYANQNHGRPYFTATSPRWTYLLTTYGRATITTSSGRLIPRYAVLIHRDDIPKHWWYALPDLEGYLTGDIPSSCLIDLASDPVSQIEALLDRDTTCGRFQLPTLEDFASVTQEQLNTLYSWVPRTKPATDESNVAIRHPDWCFQTQVALRLLHTCQEQRQGLIYDWQHQERALRAYAFTNHAWSPADVAYTSVRPRRAPVQIFQKSATSTYLLLSFCRIKADVDTSAVLVSPYAMTKLRKTHKKDGFTKGKLIVVMMAIDVITPFSQHSPLYAIPDSVINLDLEPSPRGRKWQRLILRDGFCFEDYSLRNQRALVTQLSKNLEGKDGPCFGNDSSTDPSPVHREEIYEQIRLTPRVWRVADGEERPE